MAQKVLVGMSGGVDSSMAVVLLQKQGYMVSGVTLCLNDCQACGSGRDAEDAHRVAQALGVPHAVWDMREEFHHTVMQPFGAAYAEGKTPNPCVECNRHIKFGTLMDEALAAGFDYVATGHYARIQHDPDTGRYLLRKARDLSKDQTYVLYSLTQEQLAHILFPLGESYKHDLRADAAVRGLATADKPDSQDICFVPDGNYVRFLEETLGITCSPGSFLDMTGHVIGIHRGVIAYTVGQRKGLGVAFGEPRFVVSKNAEDNTVTLGRNEDTYASSLLAEDANWIAVDDLHGPMRVCARTRYKQTECPATVTLCGESHIRVTFDEPHRAITPGQAVVLYQGDMVVGGARILRAE